MPGGRVVIEGRWCLIFYFIFDRDTGVLEGGEPGI